jgi:hypothetical protein
MAIQVAIDARHQAFSDEPGFSYQPFNKPKDKFRPTLETFEWQDLSRESQVQEVANLRDLYRHQSCYPAFV